MVGISNFRNMGNTVFHSLGISVFRPLANCAFHPLGISTFIPLRNSAYHFHHPLDQLLGQAADHLSAVSGEEPEERNLVGRGSAQIPLPLYYKHAGSRLRRGHCGDHPGGTPTYI